MLIQPMTLSHSLQLRLDKRRRGKQDRNKEGKEVITKSGKGRKHPPSPPVLRLMLRRGRRLWRGKRKRRDYFSVGQQKLGKYMKSDKASIL